MKVFISWSGQRSKKVALGLRDWLPDVMQGIKPWMSAMDIDAGVRWSQKIQDELSDTRFGIICITSENQKEPWVLFEAGALAKTIEDTYVCPYLIDLKPSELANGPLTQFQAKSADKEGTQELIRSINRASKDESLSEDKIEKAFERWWPDLQSLFENLSKDKTKTPQQRPIEDMVAEILVSTREIKRVLEARSNTNLERSLLNLMSTEDDILKGIIDFGKVPVGNMSRRHYINSISRALRGEKNVSEETPDSSDKEVEQK